jgi:hypothetical protein
VFGSEHVIAIAAGGRRVYTFGSAFRGRLGQGQPRGVLLFCTAIGCRP